MKVRVLLVLLLTVVTLQAATSTSDMTGRWHFIAEKSKGGESFPPDTTLVVKHYGARMYFEYWANNRMFQKNEYRTDGKGEKLYSNANETVVVEGRLSKSRLVITTHHIMGNEIGSQSFDDMDTWVLSKDGKTLELKASDGHNMLFQRETGKPATSTAAAPAAKK